MSFGLTHAFMRSAIAASISCVFAKGRLQYGIDMHGNHNIHCVPVHSGIPGNKIKDNGMAIKFAMVASRRIHGVGNNRSHLVLYCSASRCQLRRVGLPSNE